MELNLSLSQKLILTKEMRLSIEFLTMGPMDIIEYINKEVEKNPLIEIKDDYYISSIASENSTKDYLEKKVVSEVNLKEELLDQLRFSKIQREDIKIAIFIVESLDHRGYLIEDIENISHITKSSKEHVIRVLDIIQSLEPAGVAARTLEECLELQLKRKGIMDNVFHKIIYEYLYLLQEDNRREICRNLLINEVDLDEYIKKIKNLNPIPTSGFSEEEEIAIAIPEAYITQNDNLIEVKMNREFYPEIKINDTYREILENKNSTKEEIAYVKEKIEAAKALIRSVEKRKSTIEEIINHIVENQEEYIKRGEAYLKVMKIKDLSEKLNLHSSTISRAIKGKYLMINNNLVTMRELFTTPVNKNSGEELSNSVNFIKSSIKSIIDKEDKKSPLKDEDIRVILKGRNMNISRRTVAKYRSELKIDNVNKRKLKK
ncbi:RNA polymerase, sigma 54 subunit, RpoN/SigL [Clostridium collagenovorans DSM 3089]|uniref:RNA polymerase, sigma 54 subunit, RpoN/SigL n=1 Tax=Clostridium collagenovorans DSM 3089 TaxID=1121306 RepID=A0A1M5XZ73_9CLOT|nr:RNA polymerase factor sigma-54 [Clostridium collagenovorans]SHI05115.1 RNA polymerase, sigma 54 subunit, RpoN/SigL [Clostridium collagenovorans DSM 3089]